MGQANKAGWGGGGVTAVVVIPHLDRRTVIGQLWSELSRQIIFVVYFLHTQFIIWILWLSQHDEYYHGPIIKLASVMKTRPIAGLNSQFHEQQAKWVSKASLSS